MVSRRRFPMFDLALVGLACGLVAAVRLVIPPPYLDASVRESARLLSEAWALWRGLVLCGSLRRWHRWHVSPSWVVTPAAFTSPTGVLLGRGFPWEGPHVEALEQALLCDGGLPEGRGERGGYPALHAVGEHQERNVEISWTQLTTHLGLFGTTGSGKSRGLEVILAQVIRTEGR
jgi:hypothetical protein